MTQIKVTKDLLNNNIVMEFAVEGPLEKVWQAHAERELFEKWWGPEGWQTTTKQFDFTPGGKIHYGMKCVDKLQKELYGTESWGIMEIIEIVPMERFSYTDHFSNKAGEMDANLPTTTITNDFSKDESIDGETTLITSTCSVNSPDQVEQLLQSGIVEGYASQIVKLDKLVSPSLEQQ